MPTGLGFKWLLLWIGIAVVLVIFFNLMQGTAVGQSHDLMQVIINGFPMLLLIGVWVFFLRKMQSGTYVPPGQKEQIEALKAATAALERIAKALETRPLS